jgi:Ser/Thr protein kinase RdoA (MazF antagonist)
MPLSELAALAASIDADRHSAVADAVAARWGVPPGTARFHRSSASHVFAVPGTGYLRFTPASWRSQTRVEAVADLVRRLAERGCAVAAPIPSRHSRLVETVPTVRGPMRGTLVAEASGRSIDAADLTPAQTYLWGAALAHVHVHAEPDDRLPGPFAALESAEQALATDPVLADAVVRLRDMIAGLPREPESFGGVHGDFEPDNLGWPAQHPDIETDKFPTAFDFDDATCSWFAADVAGALRDLRGNPEEVHRVATFVAGYRSIRPLPAADLALTPLFDAGYAAGWLIRLPTVRDLAPSPADPPWLTRLHAKLDDHDRLQRLTVLAMATWKRPEA